MAGRRPKPPRVVERTTAIEVKDEQTERALTQVRATLERLDSARKRDVVEFDLVIGTNKIPHGLGRPVAGYTITPTVVSAAFAHGLNRENPQPERVVWIDVVGADQPKAVVEVW